jgi:hypothetical protein
MIGRNEAIVAYFKVPSQHLSVWESDVHREMKAVIERQRIRKAIFLFEDFVLIFVWM